MHKFWSLQGRRTGLRLFVISATLLLLVSCALGAQAPTPETPPADTADAQATAVPISTPPAGDAGSTEQDAAASEEGGTTERAGAPAVAPPAANTHPADAGPGPLIYTGELVARAEVNIVAEVPGEILEVAVEVGDRIQAGDVLVHIDSTQLEAQRAQALAGLEAAQAQLDLLTTPAKEADLAAAQAAVAAAGAAYRRAADGATNEDLRVAEAQLRAAEAAVTLARAAYNRVKGDQNIAAQPETLQLRQAELQVEAAQAQYDKVAKGTTQDVIANAYAQLAQAQVRLKNLQDGAPSEQIEAIEAQVERAETGLYLAQFQVNKAVVRAPVDGIVARTIIVPGAMATPGTQLLVIASEGVQVEIPVEELRLPDIQPGQPANISVAAYPDQVYPGEIAFIAPELDAATRTVRVTVRPTDGVSSGGRPLAPGMFATVELLMQ